MENPLHEAHEQIEHLEKSPESRLKVIVTVTILVVTMLTTTAGVLAAIWSARQNETQRERQMAATRSLSLSLTSNAQQQSVDTLGDESTEAAWRSTFLNVYSLEVGDQALAAKLSTQAKQSMALSQNLDKHLPTDESPTRDSVKYSRLAGAYAQESAGWLEKHNHALAVVTMLALALFLLGLALTIGNRPTQLGFTALSIVMTLIAGARLVQIQVSTITAPTESCVDREADATTKARSGAYDEARSAFDEVVKACPSYGTAWFDLGNTLIDQGAQQTAVQARSTWREAEDAFQKSVQTADAQSAVLYNNLGFIQILNHSYAAAASNLAKAHELSPNSPIITASLAELAIARGDAKEAFGDIKRSIISFAKYGPYLRDYYLFNSLRHDRSSFATAGITGPKVDGFFLLCREAEAYLDAKNTRTPFETHGASITDLVFKRSDSQLGRIAKFVTIGFSYHGLKVGDMISVRFYGNDDTDFDATASLNQIVEANSSLVGSGVEQPDTDFRLGLTYPGSTTMEIYLNGVAQGQISLAG